MHHNLYLYSFSLLPDLVDQLNQKMVSIRHPLSQRLYHIQQLLVTYPVHLTSVSIVTKFRHKRNSRWLHRVIVSDFSSGKKRTVLKRNLLIQWIKLRTRLVKLLSHPVVVASFFTSITKKTRLLSPVKTKTFITIKNVVNLVNSNLRK